MNLPASLLLLALAVPHVFATPSAAQAGVEAEVGTDQRSYAPGESILLWLRLRQGWEPVTGATVRVQVATPDPALGPILGEEDPEGAEDSPPELPLYDDGTHGDQAANDGIYTARFTDTEAPGTYTFRVTAEGTTLGERAFSVDRSVTRYVAVRPAGTQFVFTEEPAISDAIREWLLRFRIQDRFGNDLGPGHADSIQVQVAAGTVVEPIEDQQDGSYTVRVRSLQRGTIPIVQVHLPARDLYLRMAPDVGTEPDPLPRPRGEIELFGGTTRIADPMDLGPVSGLGARMAVPFTRRLHLELEIGTGLTDQDAATQGDRTRILQGMAGVRLDVPVVEFLVPSLAAGAGAVRVPTTADDVAWAAHAGAGVTLWPVPRLGLRATARYLSVWDRGAMDQRSGGSQLRLGLVLRFR